MVKQYWFHLYLRCTSPSFIANGGVLEDFESYTPQALMRKVQDRFKDGILIALLDVRRGKFLFGSHVTEDVARQHLQDDTEKCQTTIRSAVLYLRNQVLEMPKWQTPIPTTVETLKTCSPDLPEDLQLFFRTLFCGLHKPTGDSKKESVERKVLAMSSDTVYNVSRGSVRPWKQTVLGIGIGTPTGSTLILRILNRLGYTLSYDEVKALETAFAFTAEESDRHAPDGIELNPDLATGLAWNNYDVNMDTLDGKNTLHATVGICYQNKSETNNLQQFNT